MQRKKKFGGGQRVLDTRGKTLSDIELRKVITQTHSTGGDIYDAIKSTGPKNEQRAVELLHNCEALAQVLKS